MTIPATKLGGVEAVRLVLQDFTTLHAKRDPQGVSISDMARDVGVSHQYLSKVLKGTAKLDFDQVVRLRPRVFSAVIAALQAEHGNGQSDLITECDEFVQVTCEADAKIMKITRDRKIEPNERPVLRACYSRIRDKCDEGLRALDHEEQAERMRVS